LGTGPRLREGRNTSCCRRRHFKAGGKRETLRGREHVAAAHQAPNGAPGDGVVEGETCHKESVLRQVKMGEVGNATKHGGHVLKWGKEGRIRNAEQHSKEAKTQGKVSELLSKRGKLAGLSCYRKLYQEKKKKNRYLAGEVELAAPHSERTSTARNRIIRGKRDTIPRKRCW